MSETSTEANELKLLDQKTLALVLGVTARTVRKWIQQKSMPEPLVRDGRKLYWSKNQLARWQEQKGE